MNVKKGNNPVILNLGGAMQPQLVTYFQSRGISVLEEASFSPSQFCSHIITANLSEFSVLAATYGTVEKDIKIISTTKVSDTHNFMLHNGRMVLDTKWLTGHLGTFILDKAFQEYAGIAIGDNYPTFKELGSFNITNPFNTGEYLDRMIYQAFENGSRALLIKTYFDHLIMYLTQLKAEGKVGLPLEVSYGSFDGTFGLQIHFFAEDLGVTDIPASLSTGSNQYNHHPLKIAVNSCEFFDFTCLNNVRKVVITALWSQTSSEQSYNQGLLFSSLAKPAALNQFPSEGLSPYFIQDEIPDLTYKFSPTIVSSSAEIIDGHKQIISGSTSEVDAKQVIPGAKSQIDDSATLIKGSKTIAGHSVQQIKGGTDNNSVGEMRVKSLGNMSTGKDSGLSVNLSNEATLRRDLEKLEKENLHLAKTADGLRKQLSDRMTNDTDSDESGSRAEIIKALADKDKQVEGTLAKAAKENDFLKTKMITLGNELKVLRDSQNKLGVIRSQTLKAMEDSLNEKSISVDSPESRIRKMELEADQKEVIYQQELQKVQRQSQGKDTLLAKHKESMNLVMLKRDQEVADLQVRLNQLTLKSPQKQNPADMEFSHFSSKIKPIQLDRSFKLQVAKSNKENVFLKSQIFALDGELELAREENARLPSASGQVSDLKSSLLQLTVEKLEKELSAKELMTNKLRENFNTSLEKSKMEIRNLQDRINQLLQKDSNPAQAQQLIHMEKQNQNLSKINESLKNRISVLATELEDFKAPESKDDNKRLQMLNAQNKNLIDSLKKDVLRMQEKTSADNGAIMALKNGKSKLEQQLKKVSQITKVDQVTPNLDQEMKKILAQNHSLDLQLKEAISKIKELETKQVDASKSQKAQTVIEDGQSKLKINHLETSLKKLTQDLVENRNQLGEAKKELNKLRLEKTALQNQADKFKKEADKNKPAAPKKPNSGGKAA